MLFKKLKDEKRWQNKLGLNWAKLRLMIVTGQFDWQYEGEGRRWTKMTNEAGLYHKF